MTAAAAPGGAGSEVIALAARRKPRRDRARQAAKAAAVFALCLLGLIGSFADSAVARTGLLLIGAPDGTDSGAADSVTATLVWAMIANLAACAGVMMGAYWLLSRPSAQIVALRPRGRR